MFSSPRKILLISALTALAACAQQEETTVGIQPTFDKYGNAFCPAGYVLAGDVCLLPEEAQALGYDVRTSGTGAAPGAPGTDPDTPGQAGNTNQNQNNNQGQNQASTGS